MNILEAELIIKELWEYKELTPAKGEIYHKGQLIKHIYSDNHEICI